MLDNILIIIPHIFCIVLTKFIVLDSFKELNQFYNNGKLQISNFKGFYEKSINM